MWSCRNKQRHFSSRFASVIDRRDFSIQLIHPDGKKAPDFVVLAIQMIFLTRFGGSRSIQNGTEEAWFVSFAGELRAGAD